MYEKVEQFERKEVQEVRIYTLPTLSYLFYLVSLTNLPFHCSAGKPQVLFAQALGKKSYEKMASEKEAPGTQDDKADADEKMD